MTNAADEKKTKQELLEELKLLRRRVRELESTEDKHRKRDELLHIFRISSPIGLFVVQERKFVFVNTQFRKLLGLTSKKLLGTYSLDHVHPDDREAVREAATQMLRGELTSPYIYRIIDKSGQTRWVREGVVSVHYQGERASLGHALDITDRIESTVRLQEAYENEKKLRKDLEDEVNKRIEYTRALVHELKTPLTPVLFSSELLVDEITKEPLASIARNIHRGATNLNNRINELLDLAKVEIGKLEIAPSMVNVTLLLNNIADNLLSLMAKKNQELKREIPEDLPEVWADQDRLQQIVMNLLINAAKFTPDDGIITLAAHVDDDNFVVEVRDTGMGIPKSEHQRIFQPYERRITDRQRLSGLGLGLALCKNLVELHNGKIWIDSRMGKGSTFAFSIPLKPPEGTPEGTEEGQSIEATNR